MSLLHHIRSLHTLSPANKDHVSAWRMAISVAVPSLALLAAGRPELAGYAVFGALTGMYGRTEPHQLRLRHQGQAAVLLVAGVGVGVFLSAHHIHSWALVIIEAAFAGVGSLFTDKTALKPAGPFFGILALGACASVPAAAPCVGDELNQVGCGGPARPQPRALCREIRPTRPRAPRAAGRRARWLWVGRRRDRDERNLPRDRGLPRQDEPGGRVHRPELDRTRPSSALSRPQRQLVARLLT